MEEWRDVKGYKGYYQVSNMGSVKSLERTVRNGRGYRIVPERILKTGKNNHGYLQVHLYKEGKRKLCCVHRLVATAFCENLEGYKEINHIDENKLNNRADNLEFCSRSYNCTYNGLAKRTGKKLSKPVYSIDKESGLIMFWESAREAGKVLGIDSSHITRCCKGKIKSIGGFYWHYVSESEEVCDEKK